MRRHTISASFLLLALILMAKHASAEGAATAKGKVPDYSKVKVTTLAGSAPISGFRDGRGAQALFNDPHGVAVAQDGTIYVSEAGDHILRKITPRGDVSLLAGRPGEQGGVDGKGGKARFNAPNSMTIDRHGDLYVADLSNCAIRKITPDGVVTTIAGKLATPGKVDGPHDLARFNRPHGIDVAPDLTLYVADAWSHTIRKITPEGVVSTLAGRPEYEGSTDGIGSEARFALPFALAVDTAGNVFVADRDNHTIRKITPDGTVSTFAGKARTPGAVDGSGADARFSSPRGIVCDRAGNLFVADYDNDLIRMITPQGMVTTVAGKATEAGHADGPGSEARFNSPHGIALDKEGRIYVADSDNHAIRVITPLGTVALRP